MRGFPGIFEALWSLPECLFGDPKHWAARTLVMAWRAVMLLCALYVGAAGLHYEWFLWTTPR